MNIIHNDYFYLQSNQRKKLSEKQFCPYAVERHNGKLINPQKNFERSPRKSLPRISMSIEPGNGKYLNKNENNLYFFSEKPSQKFASKSKYQILTQEDTNKIFASGQLIQNAQYNDQKETKMIRSISQNELVIAIDKLANINQGLILQRKNIYVNSNVQKKNFQDPFVPNTQFFKFKIDQRTQNEVQLLKNQRKSKLRRSLYSQQSQQSIAQVIQQMPDYNIPLSYKEPIMKVPHSDQKQQLISILKSYRAIDQFQIEQDQHKM